VKYRLFCYGHITTQLAVAMEDVAVWCQVQTASVNIVRTHVTLRIINISIKIGTELSANSAAEKIQLRGNKIRNAYII